MSELSANGPQVARARDHDIARVTAWVKDPERKPPELEFTEGPLRVLADLFQSNEDAWRAVIVSKSEAVDRYDDKLQAARARIASLMRVCDDLRACGRIYERELARQVAERARKNAALAEIATEPCMCPGTADAWHCVACIAQAALDPAKPTVT